MNIDYLCGICIKWSYAKAFNMISCTAICIVIYKTSGISLVIYHIPRAATWTFYALGLFQSIRSYSCCALHASKYAQSHSSCYWAAVRRATYWPTLSSYGQTIIPLRLGVELWILSDFQDSFHYRRRIVLGWRYRWDLVSSESFLCKWYVVYFSINLSAEEYRSGSH